MERDRLYLRTHHQHAGPFALTGTARGNYKREPAALLPMVSLAVAAQLAYRVATDGKQASEETLNKVAQHIATHVKVFACGPRPGADPALVMPDEISYGIFEAGGSTLRFSDGRPGMSNLCIRTEDLGQAMLEVRACFKPDSSR